MHPLDQYFSLNFFPLKMFCNFIISFNFLWKLKKKKTHLLNDEIKWAIVHYKKKGLNNKTTALVIGSEYDRPS